MRYDWKQELGFPEFSRELLLPRFPSRAEAQTIACLHSQRPGESFAWAYSGARPQSRILSPDVAPVSRQPGAVLGSPPGLSGRPLTGPLVHRCTRRRNGLRGQDVNVLAKRREPAERTIDRRQRDTRRPARSDPVAAEHRAPLETALRDHPHEVGEDRLAHVAAELRRVVPILEMRPIGAPEQQREA